MKLASVEEKQKVKSAAMIREFHHATELLCLPNQLSKYLIYSNGYRSMEASTLRTCITTTSHGELEDQNGSEHRVGSVSEEWTFMIVVL